MNVPADTPITVQFDRAVTPSSVAGHFSVDHPITGCNLDTAFSAGPASACYVAWLEGNTEFTLNHTGAIFAPNRRYTFTLRGGFSDPSGAVNTVDHRWDITTAAAPDVRAVEPSDGSSAIPVDTPLSVSFTVPMAPATAAAITLEPPIADTRVVRNSRDPSRFVVLPGRLLLTDTTYRVTVSRAASDEHGQQLVAPVTATFRTGGLSPASHAIVMVRSPGEGASRIVITGLAPAQRGEPVPAATLLTAPRCTASSGCGIATAGAPLYTYAGAALSPGGRWLAVVEQDATASGNPTSLVVIGTTSGTVKTTIAGGTLPSWSPDAGLLAFARGGSIELFRSSTGTITALPKGDPLLAPAVWAPNGELLALDTGGAGAVEHVELADAIVGARYAIPGLDGASSNPVISPDGAQLAVFRVGESSAGTWVVGIGARASPPRRLDPDLVPLGYSDPGTLVAISRPPAASPGLVRVSIASDTQIRLGNAPGPGSLATIVVSPSGRQLAYLAPDASGLIQAYVENADGSDPRALTNFTLDVGEAAAVSVST